MKRAWILVLLGLMGSGAAEAGAVRYEVEGKPFEGYYLAGADKDAPLVVLVHDWDGLNGYEIKRAEMLVALGYSVFAVDLFGAGVRPSTVEDKKRLTGALYQDRTRMRTLLQGGLAEALLVFHRARPDPGTEQIYGKDTVAQGHQHLGPLDLVTVEPVPVVHQHHQGGILVGTRQVIALERLAFDLVAHRTGLGRAAPHQPQQDQDPCPLHPFVLSRQWCP
jgi:hypothetical protein